MQRVLPKVFIKALVSLLVIFLFPPVSSAKEILKIVQPFDKGVYTEEYISVTFEVEPKSVDYVKVYSSENEQAIIRMRKDRKVYHYLFRFSLGEHSVRAVAYKNGDKIEVKRVKIYRKAFLSKYYRVIPQGYEKKFFHTDKLEKECAECHDMSVNEKKGIAFLNIEDSNCFECHQPLLYKKFAHAPVANFLCLPCHSGSVKEKNKKNKGESRFLHTEPIGEKCFSCHKVSKKNWTRMKFIHDPVGVGKCNHCHNPHSSDINKNFLRVDSWELCSSCHSDKSSKKAYIKLFKERGLEGDRVEKDFKSGNFTCISCHNPHASNRLFLLNNDYSGIEDVCFNILSDW